MGLIVDVDGWVQDQKHYIALRPSFDAAQAERFKVATAPADEKKDEKQGREGPRHRRQPPPAPNVAEDAQKVAAKVDRLGLRDPRLQVRGASSNRWTS